MLYIIMRVLVITDQYRQRVTFVDTDGITFGYNYWSCDSVCVGLVRRHYVSTYMVGYGEYRKYADDACNTWSS